MITKPCCTSLSIFFFFNDTATTEIYTLSLHDALPICSLRDSVAHTPCPRGRGRGTRNGLHARSARSGHPATPASISLRAFRGGQPAYFALRLESGRAAQRISARGSGDELARPGAAAPGGDPRDRSVRCDWRRPSLDAVSRWWKFCG